MRLLGDDAPAEPPAMPDAPAFRSLRGVERDCRFFTTGVISNTSSGFVDLTSERRDDEDAFFDLRLGVAFGDVDEADPSLNCTVRYRGAVHDVRAPVLGGDAKAVRAPVVRVAKSAAPLKMPSSRRRGAARDGGARLVRADRRRLRAWCARRLLSGARLGWFWRPVHASTQDSARRPLRAAARFGNAVFRKARSCRCCSTNLFIKSPMHGRLCRTP